MRTAMARWAAGSLAAVVLLAGCLDEKRLDGDYGKDGGAAAGDLLRDSAPAVRIAAPSDNATFKTLQAIAFSGAATDEAGAKLTGMSLQWSSSIDGSIGSGADFSRALSAGAHVITLAATDGAGRTGTAKITVVVQLL